jgi:ZIP family zinc transporter/zinc and cadmium transporter
MVEGDVNVDGLIYAAAAATGNVVGALAVVRHAARSLRVIDHFVAFGAGFMLAVCLIGIVPEALVRSGAAAPLFLLLGYLAVHLTQHTVTPHFHFGEETHAVNAKAGTSALVGLLLHTFFDGVAIASAFLVGPTLGVMVFVAVLLHKFPEGVTIASLMLAGGRSGAAAVRAAGLLGLATVVGVLLTDYLGFLVRHGLALSGGVTLYVAASNLVPEFQGKRGWKLPAAFFAGAATFYVTHLLLEGPR